MIILLNNKSKIIISHDIISICPLQVLRPQSNLAVLDVWNYYVSEDLRHGPSYDLELIQLEACQQEETDAAEGTQSPARQVVMNG